MYRIIDKHGEVVTEAGTFDSLDKAVTKACDLDCEAIMVGNLNKYFVEEIGGEEVDLPVQEL